MLRCIIYLCTRHSSPPLVPSPFCVVQHFLGSSNTLPSSFNLHFPFSLNRNTHSPMGSDLDRQIDTLLQCKIITEAEVKELCLKAREILVEESNVQRVDAPVTVRLFFGLLQNRMNGWFLDLWATTFLKQPILVFNRMRFMIMLLTKMCHFALWSDPLFSFQSSS